MTDIIDSLKREGWYVDTIKMREEEFPEFSNTKEAIAELMDCDMKSFGAPVIADRLDKKSGALNGPLVLQLTSWRNVSYPKIPDHDESDGVCKLLLSDGFSSVPGVQLDGKLPISGRTPYGSKVLLSGQLPYECGHLVLNSTNCKLLGGRVEKLIERWKMSKLGANVVKKVEKDASYTKFEPFSNAKVDALSKAVKNVDINTATLSNDAQPTCLNGRDFKADKKAKPLKKSKPDKNSARSTDTPELSRRQQSIIDRPNRNAEEGKQQAPGRSIPLRPQNRNMATNREIRRRPTADGHRPSGNANYEPPNRRSAPSNDYQSRRNGGGGGYESQLYDAVPLHSQSHGHQPFGQQFSRSNNGSYELTTRFQAPPIARPPYGPPIVFNSNVPPPLSTGLPPGFGSNLPPVHQLASDGAPRRGGGRVFHRQNNQN